MLSECNAEGAITALHCAILYCKMTINISLIVRLLFKFYKFCQKKALLLG